MTERKYSIYELAKVEKTVTTCEQCDFSSYAVSGECGIMGPVCTMFQRSLEHTKDSIPIPDWCKIDKIPYTLSKRDC